jgi:hypothetical protein
MKACTESDLNADLVLMYSASGKFTPYDYSSEAANALFGDLAS